jgi:predicted ATPase/DNA-binding SARP family transcriptional activator
VLDCDTRRQNRLVRFEGVPPRRSTDSKDDAVVARTGGVGTLERASLPMPLTRFVGRERERAEVLALLGRHRWVTVVGAGGAGKSRLALSVAGDLATRCCWVSLAAVEGAELVAPTIARALGRPASDPAAALDEICAALADEPLVLLLDTCEHLADAVAPVAEVLLSRCPGLTVLATSRRPLAADGEVVWAIPPLGAEAPTDAVALFVDRASRVGSQLGPESLDTVREVCERLDGNPLAIELCAARSQVLSLTEIHTALDDALSLLVSRSRSALDRHQTVRATLDWSYRLLSSAEADLLRRLSVFVGGADLDAVAAVSAQRHGLLLDLVTGLADHSLLRVSLGATARYQLAEPVRQYARERLREAGEVDVTRGRHLAWFLAQARAADGHPPSAVKSAAYDRLRRDLPNLRAAFATASTSGDALAALALATSLAPFAAQHGLYREGRAWLETALASGGSADPPLRARALERAGRLAHLQCDYPAARRWLAQAREAYAGLGDQSGIASADQVWSSVLREQGHYAAAEALLTTGLEHWRSMDDEPAAINALARLAFSAVLDGRFEAARALASDTLASARRLGDVAGLADGLMILGRADLGLGEPEAAAASFAEAYDLAATHAQPEAMAYAEEGLGLVALERGQLDVAVDRLQAALRRQHELGDHWRSASLLVELASCRRLRGEPYEAARLLEAADALLAKIAGHLPTAEQPERDRTAAWVTEHLTPEQREAASLAGRSAPLAATMAAATEGWPSGATASATPHGQRPELLLQGLGQETIRLGDRALTPADFSYAKPRELLFFLAEHGPADKASIGVALWPEASATELRSAFHTTLHHLRGAVGPDRVLYVDGRYQLDRDELAYDVADFRSALASAREAPDRAEELLRLRRATQLYGGDFLVTSCPDWAATTRERLRDSYQRALVFLGHGLTVEGSHHAAIDVLRQALASDPLLEAAHRELMVCFDALGEPARALRQYETLRETLRSELGTAPAPSTTRLYERLYASAS